MTGYEYLMKTYPEWYPESPLITWIRLFLLIALFLIIPHIYVNFIEERLAIFLQKARGKISFKYNKILHRVRPH
ncbi:MAG: hypothetical protein J5U19_01180 [Candidatus Methanoperedens sp.]|nr:hypothetical protein [Candidatus Methanoperedens sp.]